MPEIHTTTGQPVPINDVDVDHLQALALLTSRTTADLFHAALERLRHDLIPSTRPAVERGKRGPKVKS